MSAKTNVIAIAKPSDPAEGLRIERERIVADLEVVARKLSLLAEAGSTQNEIIAELEAIGRREDVNVRQWVEAV